ncbi:Rieske 2Fe-2S domain-containing protein [Enemella evansiae]|uniref:3-phenylpropionate dioxygenase n=1 Tax=Enemella evansiae TaxID=2016499 RepID=A0A255GQ00_9ACTN|nr:Rieske 2Fe-2S domain-containing protein [Enemella evansiae]PFG68679.1 phenylpropionate dioxygenase-like ring-hydroxylating dioxygenase large terminal subunit [Propionibacteriaceae bacterium ES.041]OYN94032.1 3-phenylpropionate dioxygenase [Enemella evansiae]OYO03421.1 3-phenylpropionate dioxygenase [Enemella evansiae]OYO09339.1 3-phenylpropionate dioxygenase [Enemella evansiae]OYO09842.1 3-phenylpropionate dioxygenase [Enemella evansiae]
MTATATPNTAGANTGNDAAQRPKSRPRKAAGTRRTLTAEEISANGLRNRWYPILPSRMVAAGSMTKVTRLGVDWLLFRDSEGVVRMLEDRCPHRSAPLSVGQHLGDRIACRYHGVQVDGTGTVVSVPGMPGCALEGRQATLSLEVVEAADVIFAFVPLTAEDEPTEFSLPDRLADDEVSWFLNYAEWAGPWRFYMDNVLDPMHGAFLHRDSHSMFGGDTSARFRIRETDRGFFFEKTDQRGVNFDWVEFIRGATDHVDLEIPYAANAGPGGVFGIVGMAVPVDENNVCVFHWRTRRVQGWEREVWRFLYRTRLEARHWEVLEQDRTVLEALAADADAEENLYQHDLGVSRIRRLYKADAKAQAKVLAGEQ